MTKNVDDAGVLDRLLPEIRPLENSRSRTPSVTGAVFNVSTSVIGAGIMSIPATLKVLGVFPALILILIIAFLSDVSVDFLLRHTLAGKSKTYAGVMGEAFGRGGSLLLQLSIMLTTLGTLVMYLIIIGDVLSGTNTDGTLHPGILQQWFGIHWWNSRQCSILGTIILVVLPLVMLRRVESLRFTSAVSVLLAVVFVIISSVMAIIAIFEGKTETPKLVPDFAHQASFLELFTAVPVIVTAFTFHFNVHPIASELSKTSDMTFAVKFSLILCAAIYSTVGVFGYLLFGESTTADILVNFNQNFGSEAGLLLNDTVRLSYVFHLMLVFPLLNFSLRCNIDELLFPKRPPLASHPARFMWITISLLGLIYVAAILIPSIWYSFQFIGSTSAVCIAFIFPGAIALRDVHGISTRRDKIMASLMIFLAGLASIIAISSNITNAVS
ncbi:hypothetical protein Scep_005799 [Stephania cephalantha]|uniref:Amino acid transporter transmembrane domain-containing protein n=1 Tax=Stephania cephalantha TaxID=152367 RepID=A0AAP0KXM8_9MAGN